MMMQETKYLFADTSIFCLSSSTKYLNKDILIARVQLYSERYRKHESFHSHNICFTDIHK
jgi:hypothetical protein